MLFRSLWLATDTAYKQSVEVLARKRAYVQNKVRTEDLPDFSKESASSEIGNRQELRLDKPALENRLREWSGIFKDFPEIQNSDVRLTVRLVHRYIVNSEGTRLLLPQFLVSLEARAAVQSPDGMRTTQLAPFYTKSLDQLPPAQEISQAIRQIGRAHV